VTTSDQPTAADPRSRPSSGLPDDGSGLRALAQHFAWYLTSSTGRALLGIALVPLYVTRLTPAEFGLLATANVLAAILRTAGSPGIAGGMLRFVSEARARGDHRAARRYLVTALISSTILGIVVAAATLGVASALTRGTIGGEWWPALAAVAAATAVAAPRDLIEMDLRASTLVRAAALLSFLHQAAVTAAIVVVLVAWDGGATEVLWATAALGAAFSVVSLALRSGELRAPFSMPALREMLRFGLPTAPALIADWAIQFSDRLFLSALVGLSATGVYSFGSRIAQLLSDVVNVSVYQAWAPYVFWSHEQAGAAERFSRATTYFLVLGMCCALPLALGLEPLLGLVGGQQAYAGATTVVWLIALSYWFGLLRQLLFAPAGITKRTGITLVSWGASAGLNLALNALLIPWMGMAGAAWATLTSYIVGAALAYAVTRRLWHIPYEWRKLATILLAGVLTFAGWSMLTLPGPALAQLVLATAGPMATCIALLLLTGVLRGDDVRAVAQLRRRPAPRG
jgi:O-antigen/teichoic acid export membrane protein